MICEYELHDLHYVFVALRFHPDDPLNKEIVRALLSVFDRRFENHDLNQIRKALQSIDGIGKRDLYRFVFTENDYVYFSLPFLKDECVYEILCASLEELVIVLEEKNNEKTSDLADSLHNLPIVLVENHYSIPKRTWRFIKQYRKKWNPDFLKREQKTVESKFVWWNIKHL